MKHINDNELMEYVAGRLAPPEKEQVAQHIAGCAECAQRVRQEQMLWDSLGEWTVDTSGHKIADKIVALAEKDLAPAAEDKTPEAAHIVRRPLIHRLSFSAVLRVAASILIAVGVGYNLGKSSVTGKVDTAAASKSRPAYLSALGLGWSSELTWLILEDDSPSTSPAPEGQGR